MAKHSAGLLLYRRRDGLQVFLVHPGGPYWARKDDGAWSIPKGELDPGEDPLAAALREVREETGFTVPGPYLPLPAVRQAGGKLVTAFAAAAPALDPAALRSATFPLEWPPRSGRYRDVPEVDRGDWFDLARARLKILPGQLPLLDHLVAALRVTDPG
jgi:predicted NUDIX family NTP pyrophosphohydrolase